MAWFRLLYPHPAVVVCSLKLARLWPAARTHRDRALEAPPRNCRYGRDIGIPVGRVVVGWVGCWGSGVGVFGSAQRSARALNPEN